MIGQLLTILTSDWSSLEVLILSNNHLRRLPPGIGQLGKLRVLDLEENYLEAIPNEVGSSTTYQEDFLMRLIKFSFNLYLLPQVGRLRELNRLILQSNNLTQLPRAIGKKEYSLCCSNSQYCEN